jgi:hypothetical protein
MAANSQVLTLPLTITRISHCPDDPDWVFCLNCDNSLGLSQPESDEPERLIGTCQKCGRWYLLDWHPNSREGVMLLLPEHQILLHSLVGR